MSIEAVTPTQQSATANPAPVSSSNQPSPHNAKVDVAQFTPGTASSATPNDFRELGDVLLGEDMSMMGGDVASWGSSANNNKNASASRPSITQTPALSRSTSTFLPPTHPHTTPVHHVQTPQPQRMQQQQQQQQQQFFACPPAQLTRHASLPVTMMRHPMPMHHSMPFMIAAPPPPHMMAMPPPSLNRQRSHGYIMHAPPPHPHAFGMQGRIMAFHHPMTPMHHSQMQVHPPMNTINLSVSHQQQQQRKTETKPSPSASASASASSDNVEPIAFNNASDARMSLGELDSIALAMLSEPTANKDNAIKDKNADTDTDTDTDEIDADNKDTDEMMFKASTASSIGCGQDLECALDSLDRFLPAADQDLFRPSDFRASDLADMVAPPPPRNHSNAATPQGRAALPLLVSPHIKTISSPAEAMQMMMHVGGTPMHHMGTPTHMHMPRSSPKPMATCKVGGCDRRVRSKGFCKTHGGGRKCQIEGCKKSSQNGEFCIGHGGGKKCKHDGCPKAAQSHGLCKAHGGGARCKYPNCNKSSQGGGLCRAHGGGKRCQASGCPKGAQRGNFCATHGGFRNCHMEGCVRTDRGGGFCEVHRRGRLCKIDGCKKLSRNQGMCTVHIREEKQDEEQTKAASLVSAH